MNASFSHRRRSATGRIATIARVCFIVTLILSVACPPQAVILPALRALGEFISG